MEESIDRENVHATPLPPPQEPQEEQTCQVDYEISEEEKSLSSVDGVVANFLVFMIICLAGSIIFCLYIFRGWLLAVAIFVVIISMLVPWSMVSAISDLAKAVSLLQDRVETIGKVQQGISGNVGLYVSRRKKQREELLVFSEKQDNDGSTLGILLGVLLVCVVSAIVVLLFVK